MSHGIRSSVDRIVVPIDVLRRELKEGIDVQWSVAMWGLCIPIEITIVLLPPMHWPIGLSIHLQICQRPINIISSTTAYVRGLALAGRVNPKH